MAEVKANPIDSDNLYRYELYQSLYWTATNLELTKYKTSYKEMALKYLED